MIIVSRIKKEKLAINHEDYATESISTDVNTNQYFSASLSHRTSDSLEAKIQFTRNTLPLTINLRKQDEQYIIIQAQYGSKIIYLW